MIAWESRLLQGGALARKTNKSLVAEHTDGGCVGGYDGCYGSRGGCVLPRQDCCKGRWRCQSDQEDGTVLTIIHDVLYRKSKNEKINTRRWIKYEGDSKRTVVDS